eukprot:TRINITY_DN6549_c0_g1_i2.p1 TRINITY_DN6549_c0_g1~~TRINITY_DN6549_c0_g1_i2.p1  ORF type:complete len:713 (-),score=92.51 TRINITY_DN6549_c0_g1_i2:29-2167(-)
MSCGNTLIALFLVSLIALGYTQSSCNDETLTCSSSAGCRTNVACNSTCNTTSSTCVVGTLDCSSSNLICLTNTGSCVECTENSHCSLRNSSLPFCIGNKCVECFQTSDCVSKKDCAASCSVNNTCVAGKPVMNCTNFTYGGCVQGRCSGECTNDSGCVALYGNARRRCDTNNIPYVCQPECSPGSSDCETDQDCGATCNSTGYCVPSGLSQNNCTNSSLYCTGNGACSECRNNADCIIRTGVPTAGCVNNQTGKSMICESCTRSSDCRSDTRCNATCTNSNCVVGNYTLDCTMSGQVCDTVNGVCVDCNRGNDCPFNASNCINNKCHQCIFQSGASTQCNYISCGATCNSSNLCTGGSGACNTNATCTRQGGNQYTCRPNPCSQTNPCTNQSFPFCDSNTGTCVECGSDQHCIIKSGDCSATCNNNGVCQYSNPIRNCSANNDTKVCDQNNGVCVECAAHSDCKNTSLPYCDFNRPQNSTFKCRECYQDSHCVKDSACSGTCNLTSFTCIPSSTCNCVNNSVAQLCLSPGTCGECKTDTDCRPSAPQCRSYFTPYGNSTRCTECEFDYECRSLTRCNALCITGKCVDPLGSPLNCVNIYGSTSQCVSGTCVACQSDTDCVSPNVCQSGKCVRCRENLNCRSDSNCNAVCFNNTCINSPTQLSCTLPQVCNLNSGACAECYSVSDCPASLPYCSGGKCVYVLHVLHYLPCSQV